MTRTGFRRLLSKALIVGSQGFLGRHLKIKLSGLGVEVFSLSRDDGDLTQIETWNERNFVDGNPNAVFFCAEDTGNHQYFSKRTPFDMWSNNASIIQNLSRYLGEMQNGCHVFVFGSLWTATADKRVIDEDDLFQLDCFSPIMSLQLTKIMLLSFVRKINADSIHSAQIITPGTLFGPGDNSDHLIPSIVRQATEQNDPIRLNGGGEGIRNFIYIDDFSDLLLALLKNRLLEQESIIVTSNVNLKIKTVVTDITNKIGSSNVIWGKERGSYEIRQPSINLFRSLHPDFQNFEFRSPLNFDKSEILRWCSDKSC